MGFSVTFTSGEIHLRFSRIFFQSRGLWLDLLNLLNIESSDFFHSFTETRFMGHFRGFNVSFTSIQTDAWAANESHESLQSNLVHIR